RPRRNARPFSFEWNRIFPKLETRNSKLETRNSKLEIPLPQPPHCGKIPTIKESNQHQQGSTMRKSFIIWFILLFFVSMIVTKVVVGS
ncbi:hypothetical protein, partial [Enterovibrio norvegicus]